MPYTSFNLWWFDLSVWPSIYSSVHLSVRLPISLHVCLSVPLCPTFPPSSSSFLIPMSQDLLLLSLSTSNLRGWSLSMCTRSTGIWRGVTCRRHAAIVSTTPGGPIKQRGTNLHSHPYCPQPWGPQHPMDDMLAGEKRTFTLWVERFMTRDDQRRQLSYTWCTRLLYNCPQLLCSILCPTHATHVGYATTVGLRLTQLYGFVLLLQWSERNCET